MARQRLRLERLERRDVPSFAAAPAYLAGASPVAIAGADVNDDGFHDIVTANHTTPGMVSVLLNQGGGSFDLPKSFPSGGSNPSSLVIADFNNNGKLDIAVTNQSSGAVSILRGSGTGVFRRPQSYAAGPSPTAINVSDFNADGAPDIVVANSSTTTLSVLINNGDGTFGAPTSLNLGTIALAVTTGDFDNDGNNDFIASGHDVTCPNRCEPINSRVTLFLGHGDGTFSSGWTFNALSSPGDLIVADFDFDNKLDLVSIDTHADDKYPGKNVNVFFGNGDGTFQNPLYYVVGSTPARVDVGDTDDDGLLDIVVLKPPGPIQNVVILRGTIDGLFHPPQWHDGGVKPAGLSVVDYTGDGVVDIGVVNTVGGAGTVTVMINNGSGGFPPSPPRYGNKATYLAVADFTGDGQLDFAGTGISYTGISVYAGIGGGGFQYVADFTGGEKEEHVHADDFDSDGLPDLAISVDPQGYGYVSVALASGDNDVFQINKGYNAIDDAQSVAVADLNSDGMPDVVVASKYTALAVLYGTGGGAIGSPVLLATGATTWTVKVDDLNHDGVPDLVTPSKVLFGTGNGSFLTPVSHGGQGCFVTIGDFNQDNALDLATAACEPYATQPGDLWTVLGNGDGTFKPSVKIAGNSHPHGIKLGDFNNDGIADLVDWGTEYVGQPQNRVNIRLGNGDGAFQPPIILNQPYAYYLDVGDLNNDGNDDLVISAGYNVRVLFGNGDGTFLPVMTLDTDISTDDVTIADLNLDGHLDIAAVGSKFSNYLVGDLSVLFGNGDFTFQSPLTYVDIPDASQVIAADLDGDGDPELLVSNRDSYPRALYVFRNESNGLFAAVRTENVPVDPGALASGDFNGDGARDLAVARTSGSAGTVSVMLGNDNGFFLAPVGYGVGLIPQALTVADFNGDGQLDLASASSNGTVSILLGVSDGTFQSPVSYAAGTSAWALAPADFDLDGDADLVVANNVAAGTISFLFNNGDGSFQEPLWLGVGASPQHVVTGDFNNDGRPDVAVANFAGGIVSVILGNGDGQFQSPLHYAVADSLRWLAAADVNNDGFTDLLVTSANGVAVLFNAADWPPLPIGGGGRFPLPSAHGAPSAEPTSAPIGDAEKVVSAAYDRVITEAPARQKSTYAIPGGRVIGRLAQHANLTATDVIRNDFLLALNNA